MNSDDPRLTAYALDELDRGERATVDAELQSSPELRAELAEIRRLAGMLSEEFAAEPSPIFFPAQLAAIAASRKPANIIQLPPRGRSQIPTLAALAACIMALLAWQFWPAKTPGRVAAAGQHVTNGTAGTYAKLQPIDVMPARAPQPNPPQPVTVDKKVDGQSIVIHRDYLIVAAPAPVIGPVPPPNASSTLDAGTIIASDSLQQFQTKLALNQPNNAKVNELLKDFKEAETSASGPTTTPLITTQQTIAQSQSAIAIPTLTVQNGTESQSVHIHNNAGALGFDPLVPPQNVGDGSRMKLAENGQAAGDAEGLRYRMLPGRAHEILVVPQRREHPYRYYHFNTSADTATYPQLVENVFEDVVQQPLSTFSADVDGASYANVRRFLNENQLPPHDAVRIEEMLNYFSYDYPQPRGEDPFSVSMEVAGCPWNADHRLVRIGIKGREIAAAKRAPGNFVFLIDVSGSMEPPERLPLIKQALRHLVMKLSVNDCVAIVVYASEAGVKLASTPCSQKEKILEAIDSLTAGGSTNGGDGIQQAYRVARDHFIRGGVNRVLLCTDGDFNVGITDEGQLTRMIADKAKGGVFLTTLGVGTDNYKDALMQKLADKGNGNYYYLDSIEEAQRVLIEQMNGTLVTIAKDVKLQVEFNPAQVAAYRLIGYEKRALQKQDFNNDAKDAGEIGAGHAVTALYEIVPAGEPVPGSVDPLKYQEPASRPERYRESGSRELLTLKLRYKQPDGDRSHLMEFPLTDGGAGFERASVDFRFAAAVASFGMLLQDSEFRGDASYEGIEELAQSAKGADDSGYRSEFINLVRKAGSLRR